MEIGNTKLKNDFIMAPVKTGFSDENGKIKDKHLEFYEKRAEDLGAVTPEPFYLDKNVREIPTQLGIDEDNKINGLKKLTNVIHKGEAKAIAHLNHPGRMANPDIPGNKLFSSSEKACEAGGGEPKRMSKEDIKEAKSLYRNAAKRVEESNFDILELQFGHGYLVAQFLSDKVNEREDEYGGSFENRSRFGLEVLEEVQNVSDLPIIVRISGDEMVENGISLEEMKKFSKKLEEKEQMLSMYQLEMLVKHLHGTFSTCSPLKRKHGRWLKK